jgi:hypothetical protein
MSKPGFKAEVLPSLLAGIGRMPLPSKSLGELFLSSDQKAALKALSLTGQALRFDPPAIPSQFAVDAAIEDDRTLLPDDLRRPVLRLLASKPITEHPALALARSFDQLRLRPHPFDMPRFEAFVRLHAQKLGSTAQHWAHRQNETAAPLDYFDREILDATNWTQASPGRRAAYFEKQRSQDANSARSLLEASWPQENADMRLRLLHAMQTGLSAADQPFLLTLDKDRAPRVRFFAQRLLSRLGTKGEHPALRACLERITHAQTGLLRKRPVLALELPATVKEQSAPGWIREMFSEVSFDELAGALSLNETEIIDAAAKDANLLLALALITTADRRLDLFEVIVTNLSNAWELMSISGLEDLGLMTREERFRWAGLLIRPYTQKPPEVYFAWNWLHLLLDGPAPPSLIEIITRTKWLNEVPNIERQGTVWMEVIASLCPPLQRPAIRKRLTTFDPTLTTTAIPLLDILDAMEKVRTHA